MNQSVINKQPTFDLRVFVSKEGEHFLQRKLKCWDANTPSSVYYEWESVPVVIERYSGTETEKEGQGIQQAEIL